MRQTFTARAARGEPDKTTGSEGTAKSLRRPIVLERLGCFLSKKSVDLTQSARQFGASYSTFRLRLARVGAGNAGTSAGSATPSTK